MDIMAGDLVGHSPASQSCSVAQASYWPIVVVGGGRGGGGGVVYDQ